MALFKEVDSEVRLMLADAGRKHSAKEPALIVLSLTSARELRSEACTVATTATTI